MKFWVSRLVGAVALILTVSALTFGAMNLLGDPLFNILGPTAGDVTNPESVAKIEAAEAQYNLDKPLPVRWVLWLGDFVTGDFGVQFSSTGQPPVSDLIAERLPRSLMLLVMAQTIAVVIAVPWAIWSASRANSTVDRTSTVVTFFLIGMPVFALGIILKYIFSIRFDWFPATYVANDPAFGMGQMDLVRLTSGPIDFAGGCY